jgi:hypothetical protein
MVANPGNGATGGIGDQSWQAFSAAHSVDTNNDANIPSPFQSFGTVEQSATDVMVSTIAQLATLEGLRSGHSANFPDTSYYYQPDSSTEWTSGQQSASSMGNPLALTNTASTDCSHNHFDFSTQSQSIFTPEWRRTQQMADPRYNQVELFARYIEPWGLALSSDLGSSNSYPLVLGSVDIKVPVNFLRCESKNYHLLELYAKIQTSFGAPRD